jgi:hypothetical protein
MRPPLVAGFQVQELITAVRPEVVMVELCKDRVGLLVDEEDGSMARLPDVWHCRWAGPRLRPYAAACACGAVLRAACHL